jgi:hypothetical protein
LDLGAIQYGDNRHSLAPPVAFPVRVNRIVPVLPERFPLCRGVWIVAYFAELTPSPPLSPAMVSR